MITIPTSEFNQHYMGDIYQLVIENDTTIYEVISYSVAINMHSDRVRGYQIKVELVLKYNQNITVHTGKKVNMYLTDVKGNLSGCIISEMNVNVDTMKLDIICECYDISDVIPSWVIYEKRESIINNLLEDD